MSQIEQLAAGMNEEIKRQGVVLESFMRRIKKLEGAMLAAAESLERQDRPFGIVALDLRTALGPDQN